MVIDIYFTLASSKEKHYKSEWCRNSPYFYTLCTKLNAPVCSNNRSSLPESTELLWTVQAFISCWHSSEMNNLFEFGSIAHDLIKQTSHCHLQVVCQIYYLSLGGRNSTICIEYLFNANVRKALLTALSLCREIWIFTCCLLPPAAEVSCKLKDSPWLL